MENVWVNGHLRRILVGYDGRLVTRRKRSSEKPRRTMWT